MRPQHHVMQNRPIVTAYRIALPDFRQRAGASRFRYVTEGPPQKRRKHETALAS